MSLEVDPVADAGDAKREPEPVADARAAKPSTRHDAIAKSAWQDGPLIVRDIADVVKCERTTLARDPDASLAIALSGGGVRSAAFCMGALEALEAVKVATPPGRPTRFDGTSLIDHVDYVSSVSGGGFTAALWAHLVEQKLRWADDKARDLVRRVRSRASYLAPGSFLGPNGAFEGVAAYAVGLGLNFMVLFGIAGLILCAYAGTAQVLTARASVSATVVALVVLTLIAASMIAIGARLVDLSPEARRDYLTGLASAGAVIAAMTAWRWWSGAGAEPLLIKEDMPPRVIDLALALLALIALFIGFSSFAYSLASPTTGDPSEKRIRRRERLAATVLVATILLIVTAETIVDPLGLQAGNSMLLTKSTVRAVLTSFGGTGAAMGALWWLVQQLRDSPRIARPAMAIAVQVAAALALLSLGILHGALLDRWTDGLGGDAWLEAVALAQYAGLCLLSVFIGVWLNTFAVDGATTTHHLFRDRIAAAFFPPDAVDGGAFDERTARRRLTHYRGPDRPLWIINTALNAPDAQSGELKRPKAFRFEFTPYYCGSPRRGYGFVRTEAFGFRRSPGVMQAVTTSAAVVAPQMGEYSKLWLWVVANFLNLRLGQVARRVREKPSAREIDAAKRELERTIPKPGNDEVLALALKKAWRNLDDQPPERGWGAVMEGVSTFARRFSRALGAPGRPARGDVYLTDGGHYDNLGLMALVERKARFVVAFDAEEDRELVCVGLADVIRRARTDLGVLIEIDLEDLRGERSCEPFAVGRIVYGPGDEGRLLYVKAHRAAARGVDVQAYATLNPDFPHEATANQFFSSSQFEAYRCLGHDSVRRVFSPVEPLLLQGATDGRAHGTRAMLTAMFDALSGGVASDAVRDGSASSRSWLELLTDGSTYPAMRRALVDRMAESAEVEPDLMRGALALFQHMEDVFVAHRMAVAPRAPQAAGWLALFREYTKSTELRAAWKASRHLYSESFRRFFDAEMPDAAPSELGLPTVVSPEPPNDASLTGSADSFEPPP